MRKLWRRLLGQSDEDLGDVAQGDWAPVPQNHSPSGGWGEWLEKPAPDVSAAKQRAARATGPQLPVDPLEPQAPGDPVVAPPEAPATLPPVHAITSGSPNPLGAVAPQSTAVDTQSTAAGASNQKLMSHFSAEERALLAQQQHKGKLLPRLTPVRGVPTRESVKTRDTRITPIKQLGSKENRVASQAANPAPSAPQVRLASKAETRQVRRSIPRMKVLDQRPSAAPRPQGKPIPTPRATPSQSQWVDMIKSYGEHMTDEEILALKDQLAG